MKDFKKLLLILMFAFGASSLRWTHVAQAAPNEPSLSKEEGEEDEEAEEGVLAEERDAAPAGSPAETSEVLQETNAREGTEREVPAEGAIESRESVAN